MEQVLLNIWEMIIYYCRPTKIQKLFKSPLAAFLSAFFLKFKKYPLA